MQTTDTPEQPKVELIKIYSQETPAMRFIGRKYGRTDGGFGKQWKEWHAKGWFKELDIVCKAPDFEDGNAPIGLMRHKDGEPFQYWIGKFYAEGMAVPEGFAHVDFPPSTIGIGWVHGKESVVVVQQPLVAKNLSEIGMHIVNDEHGACWFFERYVYERSEKPDKDGNVIWDLGFFVKKAEEAK